MDLQKLQRVVVDALEDVKAHDIKVYNTIGLSDMFDRVILASGTSNRQSRALAWSVVGKVKEAGGQVISVEGTDPGEWVLVDLGDIVVHIMQPAIRDYYGLEEMWGSKPVKIKLASAQRGNRPDRDEAFVESAAAARAPAASARTKAATRKAATRKVAAGKTATRKAPAGTTSAKKIVGKPASRGTGARKAAVRSKTTVKKAVAKKKVVTAAKKASKAVARPTAKASPRKAPVRKADPKKAAPKQAAAKKPIARTTAKRAGSTSASSKASAVKAARSAKRGSTRG